MNRKPYRPPIVEIFLSAVAALLLAVPVQADDRWELAASDWSRPRNGMAVASMPPVAEAVRAWQEAVATQPAARLLLVHAGGEEGSLWAAELRDWLVALGIPPGAIEQVAGGRVDRIELRLET